MNNNVPKWLRLDNSAILYPSIATKSFVQMFRLSITLNEKIDVNLLQEAANKVIKRIPSFSYRLRMGLFWYYFSYIDDVPNVEPDANNPMTRIKWKDNKHFMFRIRYFENRIALEIFHALTDGMGGLTFLLTLAAEYLKLKHNIEFEYSDLILNPLDKPKEEEYEDAFKKVKGKLGKIELEKIAYHFKGTVEDKHILNIITGKIPLDKTKELSKQYNCSITEFIVSVMIYAIQEIKEKDKSKNHKNKCIKIAVPVNLRKIYYHKTLRNFSSYVNVGIDCQYGHYDFEEIITIVKSQMKLLVNEKKLKAKILGNVKAEKNLLLRIVPMFIKKYIISLAEKVLGDRYCSSNFSNLGNIEVPEELISHISKIELIIGRSKTKPNAASCIGFNNNLYISFSRRIKETEFEKIFFKFLVDLNIPVEIESNQR